MKFLGGLLLSFLGGYFITLAVVGTVIGIMTLLGF